MEFDYWNFDKMNKDIQKIADALFSFIEKNVPETQRGELVALLIKKINQDKEKVLVQSAIALSDEEKKALEKYFESKIKTENIEYQVDKDLVGGLKIKIGDNLLDRSLAGKIEQISEI